MLYCKFLNMIKYFLKHKSNFKKVESPVTQNNEVVTGTL